MIAFARTASGQTASQATKSAGNSCSLALVEKLSLARFITENKEIVSGLSDFKARRDILVERLSCRTATAADYRIDESVLRNDIARVLRV